MEDIFEQLVTRRQALQGAGGLVAAGLAARLPGGVTDAFAATRHVEATTVTSWIYRPEYREAIDKIVAAFEKAHPNIKIDMSYKPAANYQTLLKTALVGGAGPDTIATGGATGIRGDTGVQGGYIASLDGKLRLAALLPTAARTVRFKGHIWGAPVTMFRIGIYIQRPIFGKYKIPIPRSWPELITVSKKLKSHGVTPWIMPAQDMIIPWFFYVCACNSVLGAKGFEALRKGKRKLTDPDLVKAAQLMIDLAPYYEDGYRAIGYNVGKSLFAQGRGAMLIGGSSDYAGYVQVNPDAELGFIGFPPPKRKPRVQGYSMNGLSMGYTVNKKASHRAAATTFVSWLTSAPAQQVVLDNLGLPARKGLKPTGSSDRARILKAILAVPDLPSWLDYDETAGTLAKALGLGNGMFTGSAREFAAALQSAVVPSA
jgi:raffinose/stachyose/melibiose transport system substrate-binding protein